MDRDESLKDSATEINAMKVDKDSLKESVKLSLLQDIIFWILQPFLVQ